MASAAHLKGIFASFDSDGDGSITLDELKAALVKGGKKADTAAEIMKQVDTNNDNAISLEEFKQVFNLAPDATTGAVATLIDLTSTMLGGIKLVGKAVLVDTPRGIARRASDRVSSVLGLKDKDDFSDIKDTNVEHIGSEEDKAVRKAAAKLEKAWASVGTAEGVHVWRIENFKVVQWPKHSYGSFYEGDSYIVLHTYKESADSPKLAHDIYYWLGKKTSQDEMGTAAYKTVELDDLLDGVPIQHREVQMHESAGFKSLFKAVTYLKGGVESGFHHVEPGAYLAKLLHVKKVGKTTSVVEVPCKRDSLNEGDAFVLDAGATIYVWAGPQCSPFESLAANLAAESIEGTRAGHAKSTREIDDNFWRKLGGGKGPIKSKDAAAEVLPKPIPVGEGILYKLSDSTGKLIISEVARGDLTKAMLGSDDVFVVDPGPQLLVWVGNGASQLERVSAMNTATAYLKTQGKPIHTPVSVLKEDAAHRHPLFQKIFAC